MKNYIDDLAAKAQSIDNKISSDLDVLNFDLEVT